MTEDILPMIMLERVICRCCLPGNQFIVIRCFNNYFLRCGVLFNSIL